MDEVMKWLLFMPSAQRNAIIKSAKRMSRVAHTDVVATLFYIYQNREDLRTRIVR